MTLSPPFLLLLLVSFLFFLPFCLPFHLPLLYSFFLPRSTFPCLNECLPQVHLPLSAQSSLVPFSVHFTWCSSENVCVHRPLLIFKLLPMFTTAMFLNWYKGYSGHLWHLEDGKYFHSECPVTCYDYTVRYKLGALYQHHKLRLGYPGEGASQHHGHHPLGNREELWCCYGQRPCAFLSLRQPRAGRECVAKRGINLTVLGGASPSKGRRDRSWQTSCAAVGWTLASGESIMGTIPPPVGVTRICF